MKKLHFPLRKVKSSSSKKVPGTIFFSALIFLMLSGTLVVEKIAYYRTSAETYTNIVQENEAQAMKNMAVANKIGDNQKLEFNLGKVERQKDKCLVWLNNQKKFEFSLDSRKSD